MILAKAPIMDGGWLLADWLEFKVLTSEFHVFRLRELLYISDEEQDEENLDIGEQDSINQAVLESALNEITQRIQFLKTAYPFDFSSDDSELILKEEITAGSYVYLYCLFISHIKREDVLIPDPPHSNADRDILQICATLAAAGKVHGNAISFGFPRPDHSHFINALDKAYKKIGEGVIVETIPAGAPAHKKDAGIDVIAWENTPDDAAGKIYILGQVATGQNWEDKSVRLDIGPFHKIWFTRQPVSTPIPAMFIPFCLDTHSSQSLKEVIYYKTFNFGDLIYRYRLPAYAAKGYELAEKQHENGLYIERFNEFDKVRQYVDHFRATQLASS